MFGNFRVRLLLEDQWKWREVLEKAREGGGVITDKRKYLVSYESRKGLRKK